ncbi:TolC family protein [Shivajiella indica]|uniref:TolC family protein n=1 Tax=Shivajiella indica TaxID=872115 RepID=A0ABW5BEY0_9BACT
MKKYIITLLLTCSALFPLIAQSDQSSVLEQIERNNKTIQAQKQNLEAQKLEFKVDLPLYNPNFEYDYMIGSPSGAGSLTDIWINQSFDFPTAYGKRKKLSEGLVGQADLALMASRQEILLQAQKNYIELVFRNKLQKQISSRQAATEKLLIDFEKKLETGDGNILDVNKAKLQLIEINKEYQLNLAGINQLQQNLKSLNGGLDIELVTTDFPEESGLPEFEALFAEFKLTDPLWKYYELENETSKKQVELMKAMALPKISTGYRYQTLLGQTFQGFRVGASIPLWENKYKVRQKEAELSFAVLQWTDYQNTRYFELRQLYERYEKLSATLQDYRNVLENISSIAYLDKALELGHISTIEYFLESNYFYMAYTNYLQTENDYHQVKAELLRFRL